MLTFSLTFNYIFIINIMEWSKCDLIFSVYSFETFAFKDENVKIGCDTDTFLYFNEVIELFFAKKCLECYNHCQILIDYVWEKLNTGHWKNVSQVWRKLYTSISCLSALSQYFLLNKSEDGNLEDISIKSEINHFGEFSIEKIIRTCDMGLLMGYPLERDILASLATHLHKHQLPAYDKNLVTENMSDNSFTRDIDYQPGVEKIEKNVQSVECVHFPSIYTFQ